MENMNKNIAYEHIDFSEITKVRFCTLVEKCNYIPIHRVYLSNQGRKIGDYRK